MDCNQCGAEIRWAEDIVTGEKVKLSTVPEMVGPNRYREVGYRPLKVQPIGTAYQVSGYPIHDCGR